jgi:hypothetical protein
MVLGGVQFDDGADEVVSSFVRSLEEEAPPSRIYHYTSDVGMRGILESGMIWLTDIFNLNDPSELRHGVQPAIEILAAAAQSGMPEVGQFSKNMAAMLRGRIEEVASWFVCSFSKSGDELGQWRAYGDNGRGYALGFDGDALEQAFTRRDGIPILGPMTFPITYGDAKLRNMQQSIIAPIIPLLSAPREISLSSKIINEYMSELSISLSVILLRLALFLNMALFKTNKNTAFYICFLLVKCWI